MRPMSPPAEWRHTSGQAFSQLTSMRRRPPVLLMHADREGLIVYPLYVRLARVLRRLLPNDRLTRRDHFFICCMDHIKFLIGPLPTRRMVHSQQQSSRECEVALSMFDQMQLTLACGRVVVLDGWVQES